MTKENLIERVAEACGSTKSMSRSHIDAIFSVISQCLKNDDFITIIKFGTFKITRRNERIGRNPRTGDKITISAKNAPTFKASTTLKDFCNNG